ncbi:hypothetical protein K505DRAFT_320151 [Melanomma pulvis-pyrius CBS 109.77]|uniref:Zn(2)-C6 fungal-type domain-containing protein n=1 Tax=Melanomma pulvis-pyrius CBS 109.77 TaxID=1314802 RepID=A0A6A6XXE2_9PLEO|nr:hypothetical protein K505DRAFT_320151 [Melanomma pulvis-pyrius CBS 109.77]
MVGAPSTNRCGACKARKVKCDEAWPTCGPCRKGSRTCPGPPINPTRFVEYNTSGQELPIRRKDETQSQHPPRLVEIDANVKSKSTKHLRMVPLKTTKKVGGTFQKIRLIDFGTDSSSTRRILNRGPHPSQSPSLTAGDEVAWRFYNLLSIDVSSPGARLHCHGIWHRELLQRFGASPALDDVTLLMLSSNDSIARGEDPLAWFDLKQYGKALQSLQSAIDNPKTRFDITTLAAIALIYRTISGLAATHGGVHKQAIHAQALSKMLKVRGIRNRNDPLEYYLAVECQIAATQDSLASDIPQPCVFDSEQWGIALKGNYAQSSIEEISWKMYREMVKWPRLLNMLSQGAGNTENVLNILQRAIAIATNLERLSHTFEDILRDPKICTIRRSKDPLVPLAFEFRDTVVPPHFGFFCLYNITINRFIIDISALLSGQTNASLTRQQNLDYSPVFPDFAQHAIPFVFYSSANPIMIPLSDASVEIIRTRNAQLCQKIWMLCEQGRTWKPLGGLFLLNPLRGTFPFASPEMRKWIFDVAVEVEGYVQEVKEWSVESMSPQWAGWTVY